MIIAMLQARFSSTRLPGKVLKTILGKSLLELQIERVQRSKNINRLIIASTTDISDDAIETLCDSLNISCFRGSHKNVLDRFFQAALRYQPNHIVRLTGDCPLTDPEIIDRCIEFYLEGDFDYVSNTIEHSFPDGLDVEIFKFSALANAWQNAKLPSEKEHVTPYIHQNTTQFKIGSYKQKQNLSSCRWTVDEYDDFNFVTQIYENLYPCNPQFKTKDILKLISEKPELTSINEMFVRNEGYTKSLKEDQEWLEKNDQQ